MRILENVELPSAFADVIVKPKNTPVTATKDNIDQLKDSKEDAEALLKKEPVKEEVIPEKTVGPPKMVRMANLSVVGGHVVNGVAEIHSKIVKEEVFNEFVKVNFKHEIFITI